MIFYKVVKVEDNKYSKIAELISHILVSMQSARYDMLYVK